MKNVTLKTIAELSGVSAQTVSRILRGQGAAHAAKTRERVLKIARELDYRPNLLSRALLGHGSRTLGLVMGGLGDSVTMQRTNGFIHAAGEHGYLVFHVNAVESSDDCPHFMAKVSELLDHHVDGLVVYRGMPLSVAARRMIDAASIPVVFIDWAPPQSERRIMLDRAPTMRRVAEYLVGLGHEQAVYLPGTHAYDFREHCILPYQRAFAMAGGSLRVDRRWAVDTSTDVAQSAYETTRAFLADPENQNITAILYQCDAAAQAGITAARDAGVDVPGDLSIVGWGDAMGTAFATPPLTTVRLPGAEVGLAAFDMLHRLLDDPTASIQRQVAPLELITRASTGPARTACRSVSS